MNVCFYTVEALDGTCPKRENDDPTAEQSYAQTVVASYCFRPYVDVDVICCTPLYKQRGACSRPSRVFFAAFKIIANISHRTTSSRCWMKLYRSCVQGMYTLMDLKTNNENCPFSNMSRSTEGAAAYSETRLSLQRTSRLWYVWDNKLQELDFLYQDGRGHLELPRSLHELVGAGGKGAGLLVKACIIRM